MHCMAVDGMYASFAMYSIGEYVVNLVFDVSSATWTVNIVTASGTMIVELRRG